jgi:hypothetical protein
VVQIPAGLSMKIDSGPINLLLSSSDNLSPARVRAKRHAGKGGGGEAQRAQLQPFSVRFKNIIVKLEALCTFF